METITGFFAYKCFEFFEAVYDVLVLVTVAGGDVIGQVVCVGDHEAVFVFTPFYGVKCV